MQLHAGRRAFCRSVLSSAQLLFRGQRGAADTSQRRRSVLSSAQLLFLRSQLPLCRGGIGRSVLSSAQLLFLETAGYKEWPYKVAVFLALRSYCFHNASARAAG